MIFFFDENTSPRIARMLAAYDLDSTVRNIHDDKHIFLGTKDIPLLDALRTENPKPVLITADVNMATRHPDERQALANSGLTVVFFTPKFHDLDMHQQAIRALTVWPAIVDAVRRYAVPTAFAIKARSREPIRLGPTSQLKGWRAPLR